MQQTHSSSPALRHFFAAAAIALGLGGAGASLAATSAPVADERAVSDGGGSFRHGHAFAHDSRQWGRQLARLHHELKLDAQQEALWQAAEQGMREARKGLGERLREEHRQTRAALAAPDADLRAVLARLDEQRAERDKLRLADRERWLALYDSLNPTQKEQARNFLRQQLERHDARGERAGARR